MSRDALISACFTGDADAAVRLLAQDPSLAAARCDGIDSPALILAAHRGYLRIVEALLEAGAPVDDREGASGTTALHWAAEGGHPAVAAKLLASGAAIAPVDDWFGLTPLGWATVVDWNSAFREDRPATIELLLAHGSPIDAFSAIALDRLDVLAELPREALGMRLGIAGNGRTPLHVAITLGHGAAVAKLIELGADPGARTDDGLSPLGLARIEGQTEIAAQLIAAGATEDVSARLASDPPDATGATPDDARLLHALASRDRAAAIAALLAAGAPPDVRMPALVQELRAETTPLARAAQRGHAASVAVLLAGGANPNGRVGAAGLTPLHLAAAAGASEVVDALLAAGADPTARELEYQASPGDLAEHFGHEAVAEKLRAAANRSAGA